MLNIRENAASSILTPQNVGSLSSAYDYTINPYAGCAFACSYCYVPKFPNARHAPGEWGQWVEVKTNAPELLHKERRKIFGSRIFFSSATDPYQYLELKYRLTRRCLEQLHMYPPKKLTMHTRSHLMLQDIELLKSFGKCLSVGVSFTTDNDSIRREFEPHAPSLKRRLELIRRLQEEGIEVFASIAPLLPCDPDRLHRLLTTHTNRAWVDTMRWTEVVTNPMLLKKYGDFFETNNYEKVRKNLAARFQNTGLGSTDSTPSNNYSTKPKDSAHATLEQPQIQLKLFSN